MKELNNDRSLTCLSDIARLQYNKTGSLTYYEDKKTQFDISCTEQIVYLQTTARDNCGHVLKSMSLQKARQPRK